MEGDLRDAKRRVTAAKGPRVRKAVANTADEDDDDAANDNDISEGESE